MPKNVQKQTFHPYRTSRTLPLFTLDTGGRHKKTENHANLYSVVRVKNWQLLAHDTRNDSANFFWGTTFKCQFHVVSVTNWMLLGWRDCCSQGKCIDLLNLLGCPWIVVCNVGVVLDCLRVTRVAKLSMSSFNVKVESPCQCHSWEYT